MYLIGFLKTWIFFSRAQKILEIYLPLPEDIFAELVLKKKLKFNKSIFGWKFNFLSAFFCISVFQFFIWLLSHLNPLFTATKISNLNICEQFLIHALTIAANLITQYLTFYFCPVISIVIYFLFNVFWYFVENI